MAKRVGLVLTGCGRLDGSDVAETMMALLVIERAGAVAVCAAPDVDLPAVVDHATGERTRATRKARVEAARLAGASILPLGELGPDVVDALVIPGGNGPIATLSDYPEKHELCQVDPLLFSMLRGMLKDHRPHGVHRPVGAAGGARARPRRGRAHDRRVEGDPRREARRRDGRRRAPVR